MEISLWFLILVLPVMGGLISLIVHDDRIAGAAAAISGWFTLAFSVALFWPFCLQNLAPAVLADGLTIDQLGAWFVLLTSLIVACCLTHSLLFFECEKKLANPPPSWHVRLFFAFSCFFQASMLLVFLCDSLGYLWIAVEATTLLSAPLVYFNRTKNSVEATWKYLIICSVGIAFALVGTIFIYAASQGIAPQPTLNLQQLTEYATKLNYPLFKLGFVFCLLGYGTKSGAFPLHNWLPDAHSEAPAPASAMLSGALLNTALYAVFRIVQLDIACKQTNLGPQLCIWIGTITVVAASLFLIRQHGLKRLWAYSSIENVGLMLVAIGLSSPWLFFLQAMNHSIAKSAAFLLSGNIINSAGTKNLDELRGLLSQCPVWAGLIVLCAWAVTGAPPFGLFLSEWMILIESMRVPAVAPILIVALAIAFIAVSYHVGRMLVGSPLVRWDVRMPLISSLLPAMLIACSAALCLFARPW